MGSNPSPRTLPGGSSGGPKVLEQLHDGGAILRPPVPPFPRDSPPRFVTPRTRIEPLEEDHALELFRALSDPRIYEFLPEDPPASEAELLARIERWTRGPGTAARERWFNWAVLLTAEPAVAGSLQATVDLNERQASVAYLLAPKLWGQGIAREALVPLLAWLRSRDDVSEVIAVIDSRNVRSLHLVRRLGFELVRTVRHADFFKGSWSDELTLRWAGPTRSETSGE